MRHATIFLAPRQLQWQYFWLLSTTLLMVVSLAQLANLLWRERQILRNDGSGGQPYDAFGSALEINRDWMANGYTAGSAWHSQVQSGVMDDGFGVSVALQAGYLVVGAQRANESRGTAAIFRAMMTTS